MITRTTISEWGITVGVVKVDSTVKRISAKYNSPIIGGKVILKRDGFTVIYGK